MNIFRDISNMELSSFAYSCFSLVSGQEAGSSTLDAALAEWRRNAPKNNLTHTLFYISFIQSVKTGKICINVTL